jgi:hypothetical protein
MAQPAHAIPGDPVADAHATVLPSGATSIATVCLQIRPADPSCITIP